MKEHSPDSVVYSKGAYGTMQHEELKEVFALLDTVRRRINSLHIDCPDIAADREN